jgi:Flp pilus assembly protein TadD
MVRMVYGNYLLKAGQIDKATEQFQVAVDLDPENPTINYNLGLLYMKKKDYEQANTYAKKAYELGFPLPGLKNQLMEAGKWND